MLSTTGGEWERRRKGQALGYGAILGSLLHCDISSCRDVCLGEEAQQPTEATRLGNPDA